MGKILVTGGTGYIGSHTVVELIDTGHEVVIVDNLSNSNIKVLDSVKEITGTKPVFIKADLRDRVAMKRIFDEHNFEAALHFAGLKSVGESVEKPLEYYDNNINSTLVLVEQMLSHKVNRIVFSSSATVYGSPSELPLHETSQVGVGITNPYGWTKYMIEQILRDVAVAHPGFQVALLRYFNPIGAHTSGLMGENPSGIPNNLLPYITDVAVGKLPYLKVFGDDYDTPDGTGVRDYIHVTDLAKGHIAALNNTTKGVSTYNLGTGVGVSVLDLIKSFEKASDRKIPYKIVDRRAGDIATCYASPDEAYKGLSWRANLTIDDACRDSWNWAKNHPDGY